MTRPKGVRVTVERWDGGDADWCDVGYTIGGVGYSVPYDLMKSAGAAPLKPGKSVTGRMVFIADKGKR